MGHERAGARVSRACRSSAWTLAALLSASAALAQGPTGPEFKVNSPVAISGHPTVAVLGDGRFLVAWDHQSEPAAVEARVFDAAGAPLAPQRQVNSGSSSVGAPSVAPSGDGFVLVWGAAQGNAIDVVGRRLDAAGQSVGDEFRVSAGAPSWDGLPRVASAPDGSFVVVWTNYTGSDGAGPGVFGRRYSPAAVPLGPPFQVNTYTTGSQGRYGAAVAVADDGAFAVIWVSTGPPTVSGQIFDAAGRPRGGEFLLLEGADVDDTSGPAVAPTAGGFIAAWSRQIPPDLPSSVVTQFVTADGRPIGPEGVVDETFGAHATSPTLASLPGGRTAALWRSWLRFPWEPYLDLRARMLDGAGAPLGREFRVGARLHDNRGHAAAPTPDGGFVAAWVPASEMAVYARRFAPLAPARAALVDAGNGVLEPGESAVLAPSWTNFGDAAVPALSALARTFAGPGDGPYTIADGQAGFGDIPAGATVSCAATGDCYGLAVPGPTARPVLHWDATLTEELSTGQQQATSVHVGESFADVPPTSAYYRGVETALHRGLTAGCGAAAFCPDAPITRAQMSLFVLVADEGAGYRPPACQTQDFDDVPITHPFCPWIIELGWRQVTAGCGDRVFCPDAPITRAQASVFVLRTLDPSLQPPGCQAPVFNDLPASSPFCRWVEELARRGVIAGCGGGAYCPDDPVTRGQMASMLTAAFGLTLYGP